MVGNDDVCMGKIGDSNGTGVDGYEGDSNVDYGYEGDGYNSHDDGRDDNCD